MHAQSKKFKNQTMKPTRKEVVVKRALAMLWLGGNTRADIKASVMASGIVWNPDWSANDN